MTNVTPHIQEWFVGIPLFLRGEILLVFCVRPY